MKSEEYIKIESQVQDCFRHDNYIARVVLMIAQVRQHYYAKGYTDGLHHNDIHDCLSLTEEARMKLI